MSEQKKQVLSCLSFSSPHSQYETEEEEEEEEVRAAISLLHLEQTFESVWCMEMK